ncbi:uncharacterized protein LOC132714026 isoform X2 [Ruditapes philippinarum]|uniref:uncharacterized protein LOC132714026 isoform X2 n=1 Tax=Ruditapes philippinarum TaxID=129788 RepID=UPI00295BFCF0|nr:uncharacterized protein LOC132714026 isoform X2 [Ruditapes philippinarum]
MGSGKGSGKNAGEALVAIGIVYWNDCPANPAIPRYMSGSAGVETFSDIIIGCISCCTEIQEKGIAGAAAEHLIGIIVGSILVFSDYSYLAGGCNGAKDCCDENFIKFALSVSIIEWLLLLLPIVVFICFCIFG